MSKLAGTIDLLERLAIAERAIADATARIDELTHALGELSQAREADISQSKAVVIGADTVSPFCAGFYQREYDAADRPYRWTGRGNLFELRFPLNRGFAWDFSLELQQNAHVDIGRLRGYVDYLEIPLDLTSTEAVVRGVIPSRPFGRQAVLTFQLPGLFVPSQINPESTDTRTLGLVFYEFRAVASILNEERASAPVLVRTDMKNGDFATNTRTSLAAGAGR